MVEHSQAVERYAAEGGEAPREEPVMLYFGVYALFTVLAALSVSARGAAVAVGCYRASLVFHDGMLANVVRAPVAFFDTTPTGRILNRFASDTYTVDNDLRQNISMLLMCVLRVLFVAVVIFYVTPAFVVVALPLGALYFYVQKFYRESSRELKRIESVRAPPAPYFDHYNYYLTMIYSRVVARAHAHRVGAPPPAPLFGRFVRPFRPRARERLAAGPACGGPRRPGRSPVFAPFLFFGDAQRRHLFVHLLI